VSRYHYPERFLGLDDETSQREKSGVWVLPIPFEMTTSYIGGTKFGPDAMIEASNHVELYDPHVGSAAALEYGVHTLPTFHPTLTSPQAAIASVKEAVYELPLKDRLLATLGGEHSITPGIVAAFSRKYPDMVIVQIDSQGDLREEVDGSAWTRNCAMQRCLPYAPVKQFGIRAGSQDEIEFARKSDRVNQWTAEDMHSDPERRYLQELKQAIEAQPVYLTIDLNGLDPSVIRSTGAPEPGGLSWYECLDLIRTVAENSRIIAFDCVELSPTSGDHASAYAAAKLVYKTMNYVMLSRGLITPTVI
jgi:agmatinase